MQNRITRSISLLLFFHGIALFIALAPTARATGSASQLPIDGRLGRRSAAGIAAALANYSAGHKPPIDAMVLAGDNFYVPLSGTDDPAWQNLFEQMYDPVRLNFPFYASLGDRSFTTATNSRSSWIMRRSIRNRGGRCPVAGIASICPPRRGLLRWRRS